MQVGSYRGTISVNAGLTFHSAMLVAGTTTGSPGILITPPTGAAFAKFTCYFVGFPVSTKEVTGAGVLGTITVPKCGAAAQATAELAFEDGATTGHQKYISYTGVNYHLSSNGVTAAIVQKSTITFAGARGFTAHRQTR